MSIARVVLPLSTLLVWLPSPRSLAAPATPQAKTIHVVAKLVTLPQTKRCRGTLLYSMARYRVLRWLRNTPPATSAGQKLLVMHACPALPRGFSRKARGTIIKLRPGQIHQLRVRRLGRVPSNTVDPFDPALPRYRAVETDLGPWPPRMIVTVEGGGGTNHRLEFDRRALSVGSSIDADVRLDDRHLHGKHVQLQVKGDHVVVQKLHRDAQVSINGHRLKEPQAITYRDRIALGRYTLNVSLLTEAWLRQHQRR